jgi:hypothetical protein
MMKKVLALIIAILVQPIIFSNTAAKATQGQGISDQIPWNYAFAGNTLVIPSPDQPSRQTATYLVPDGSGWAATKTGSNMGELRRIRWFRQSDGLFCTTLTDSPNQGADCSAISTAGGKIVIIVEGKPSTSCQVLQGDAWKLEERALGKPIPTLAGKAAGDALISNTFIVTTLGDTSENGAYYFQADGTGKRLAYDFNDNSEHIAAVSPKQFLWAISESGKLCLSLESKMPKDWSCPAVSITGDRIIWKFDNGYSLYGRLVPTDTKNLSSLAMAAAKQMHANLIGNTLFFRRPDRPGEESAIYLKPEGIGRATTRVNKQNRPSRNIQWLLRDDRKLFCFTEVSKEARHAKFTQDECFDISIENDNFTLKLGQKHILSGNILKGNAWNL